MGHLLIGTQHPLNSRQCQPIQDRDENIYMESVLLDNPDVEIHEYRFDAEAVFWEKFPLPKAGGSGKVHLLFWYSMNNSNAYGSTRAYLQSWYQYYSRHQYGG